MMDQKVKYQLNLKVLKRYDPNIQAILDSSSHAVVYDFDIEKQSWNMANYEGAFFLFKRAVAPYYGIFILNRKSLDNFIKYLNMGLEASYTEEFIILSRPDDKINGIWLYEENDRARIASSLENYTKKVSVKLNSPEVNNKDQRYINNEEINEGL